MAVLPFTDMSERHDQEYFSDGLAEELIDALTRIPQLRVPARTSSFSFKGKAVTVGEIGRALGVSHVLEGSVRKSGEHMRITAQLVRADDGFDLWSQTYDRDLRDVFAVQDDIARAVADELKLALLSIGTAAAGRTTNMEARQPLSAGAVPGGARYRSGSRSGGAALRGGAEARSQLCGGVGRARHVPHPAGRQRPRFRTGTGYREAERHRDRAIELDQRRQRYLAPGGRAIQVRLDWKKEAPRGAGRFSPRSIPTMLFASSVPRAFWRSQSPAWAVPSRTFRPRRRPRSLNLVPAASYLRQSPTLSWPPDAEAEDLLRWLDPPRTRSFRACTTSWGATLLPRGRSASGAGCFRGGGRCCLAQLRAADRLPRDPPRCASACGAARRSSSTPPVPSSRSRKPLPSSAKPKRASSGSTEGSRPARPGDHLDRAATRSSHRSSPILATRAFLQKVGMPPVSKDD